MSVKKLTVVASLVFWPAVAMGQPQDAQSRYTPTGPPPEEGYQPYDEAVRTRGQKVIAGVPAYLWRHGCGPTAAGMVIGYWDGQGYDQLIPGNASTQTAAVNQAITSGDPSWLDNCSNPGGGHFADYSCPKDWFPNLLLDKSSTGGAHASDCLGDFMQTSWSAASPAPNYYGWSWFSDVPISFLGYTGYANATYGASYQATSYNEQWGTFTWAKYVAEIDADRPMVFLVDSDGNGDTDHFVPAIGWRNTWGYDEYAFFDTWVTSVRWAPFQGLGSGAWGIFGATYCSVCPIANPPTRPPGEAGYDKVRYISMVPGNPGRLTALRVTFTTLPPPFGGQMIEKKCWVGEPATYCENGGVVSPPCPPTVPATDFVGANLQGTPHCMDWSTVGVLHVTDDEIVPAAQPPGGVFIPAIYDVQAIDCECDFTNPANYSAPLTITTSKWGDLVGTCAVIPCSPPNGVVNMGSDVTALLDKFRNVPNAVLKSRADLDWNIPNQRVDITEVMFCLDAFRGFAYPAAQTPPDPGWPGPDGCP